MKVIFLQDLSKVARAGETKEVADGFARNFLLPKGIAVVAGPGAETIVARRQAKMVSELAEVNELANKLNGLNISLKAKVGAKDRLYGSITAADIASELNKTAGVNVDKRKVVLDKPIRQLGSYEVPIRLAKDIVPKVNVIVTEQETQPSGQ